MTTPTKMFKTWKQRLTDAASGEVPLTKSQIQSIYNGIYGGRGGKSSLTRQERYELQALVEGTESGFAITREQTQQGLDWLNTQIKERARRGSRTVVGVHNPAFTAEDAAVVLDFWYFTFVGALLVRDNGYVQQYAPVYRVVAHDGRHFDYAHGAWQTGDVGTKVFNRSWVEPAVCPACNDPFEPTDAGKWGDLTKRQICTDCYSVDMSDHRSSLVLYSRQAGKRLITFGDETAAGEGLPEWALDLFPNNEFPGRQYHHTDGWRGYYCTERGMDMERWTVLTEGWVTGFLDDTVAYKQPTIDFMARLEAGEDSEYPPVNLIVLFEGTSNVFSTAATYLVAKGDEDALREWAAEDVSIDQLDGALR